jgi:D-psicose/D-tagatose/L-ribulose 3-epimerase
MVKMGVHLYLWTEVLDDSALRLIGKAAALGFDGVEVPLGRLDLLDASKTRRELDEHGMVGLGSVGLDLDHDLTSSDAATRRRGVAYMKRCVAATASFGGDAVNGVIYTAWGKITGRRRTTDEWRYSVEALREICQYAQDYGVTLGVEPVNRFETYFLNTAADAVKLARDVGEPNIKVHLDTFHMNIEEKGFYQPIKDVGDLLGHLHCCANDRGVPGTGHVDWEAVFRALSETGYDQWLVIESFTPETKRMAAATAIWREVAPNADSIAVDGLAFLKGYAARILDGKRASGLPTS